MKQRLMQVIGQKETAPGIFEMKLQHDHVRAMQSPGQFVHIKTGTRRHPVLRRPISIADVEDDVLTIIYRVEGEGTKLMKEAVPGSTLDVLGPLGSGFPLPESGRALLIGGGVGIPPLYYLMKALKARGVKVEVILGYRSREQLFKLDDFIELADRVIVTTEDGSFGHQGFVTDAAAEVSAFDQYYACGPGVMLRAVETTFGPSGYVSLEERMGCGIGACLACVCERRDQAEGNTYAKACSDGPVFRAGEVVL
ncbi:dihydroorotate dehydrogenase electron transfer subunit [Alkalicoccus chagannorensis]|uniref:dihydroorotate dehydrogenase electron transfer subunit n=1 Tax=Alkalicoccus chagannorensis TaxID=427072 RepID=UPI0004099EC1|nr:dihydroorotate dehydrogenase electron transfer subunit [Alkalicoccus chagannorensis]